MRRKYLPCLLLTALGASALQPLPLLALPDDANKPFEVNSPSGDGELFLDEGLVIYRGPANAPATVRQGSMLITGTEIRIKRTNGVLQSATAVGNPARFEQQPAADQAVVYISGNSIQFDNTSQTLTIDAAAEFTQGENNLQANHIDYDIKTRHVSATSGGNTGEPVRSTIAAPPPATTP